MWWRILKLCTLLLLLTLSFIQENQSYCSYWKPSSLHSSRRNVYSGLYQSHIFLTHVKSLQSRRVLLKLSATFSKFGQFELSQRTSASVVEPAPKRVYVPKTAEAGNENGTQIGKRGWLKTEKFENMSSFESLDNHAAPKGQSVNFVSKYLFNNSPKKFRSTETEVKKETGEQSPTNLNHKSLPSSPQRKVYETKSYTVSQNGDSVYKSSFPRKIPALVSTEVQDFNKKNLTIQSQIKKDVSQNFLKTNETHIEKRKEAPSALVGSERHYVRSPNASTSTPKRWISKQQSDKNNLELQVEKLRTEFSQLQSVSLPVQTNASNNSQNNSLASIPDDVGFIRPEYLIYLNTADWGPAIVQPPKSVYIPKRISEAPKLLDVEKPWRKSVPNPNYTFADLEDVADFSEEIDDDYAKNIVTMESNIVEHAVSPKASTFRFKNFETGHTKDINTPFSTLFRSTSKAAAKILSSEILTRYYASSLGTFKSLISKRRFQVDTFGSQPVHLTDPKVLVKYLLPKEMTPLKKSLLQKQSAIYNVFTRSNKVSDLSKNSHKQTTQPTIRSLLNQSVPMNLKKVNLVDRLLQTNSELKESSVESIPFRVLKQAKRDRLSLEQIQNILYQDYGVLASSASVETRFIQLRDEPRSGRSRKGSRLSMSETRARKKKRLLEKAEAMQEQQKRDREQGFIILPLDETISLDTLAELMKTTPGELSKHLMFNHGVMVNINGMISRQIAKDLLYAFNRKFKDEDEVLKEIRELEKETEEDELEKALKEEEYEEDDEDDDYDENVPEQETTDEMKKAEKSKVSDDLQKKIESNLLKIEEKKQLLEVMSKKFESSKLEMSTKRKVPRAPIVTVMGHVDHGKTTLLDSIRNSRVAQKEVGGITQAISAFNVPTISGRNITFIDTPGHAAFSEMRKRGAQITDIVVLVVAADDGVMEQTIESIKAAKDAKCPIVVAINKVDLPGVDINRVKGALTSQGVLLEEYGGDVQCAEISAKQKTGIDDLLEKVLLQADVMEVLGEIDEPLEGMVLEAKKDKRVGVMTTALVQKGIVQPGQWIVAGSTYGKIKFLYNDQNKVIKEAGPSQPVRIVGLSGIPNAGDKVMLALNEDKAKEMAFALSSYSIHKSSQENVENILSTISSIATGGLDTREVIKIPVIIKADVPGSLEAIQTVLSNITVSDEHSICKIDFVSTAIGDISTSDILMAKATKARIIGFNVKPASTLVRDYARSNNIQLSLYQILYHIIDDMKEIVTQTLSPLPKGGRLLGKAEIKKIFKIQKNRKVAGCTVIDGKIFFKPDSGVKIRVIREKKEIYHGQFASLKIVKTPVEMVEAGQECGIQFDDEFEDFEEGDIIQCYTFEANDPVIATEENETSDDDEDQEKGPSRDHEGKRKRKSRRKKSDDDEDD